MPEQRSNGHSVSIELDLIEYSEKKGINMTNVKNDMDKHYGI